MHFAKQELTHHFTEFTVLCTMVLNIDSASYSTIVNDMSIGATEER